MEEINEYEKQANSFLEKTGTTFKAVFSKHGKHFSDDKEDRDIYDITLTRGERVYPFKFGQSIAESGLRLFYAGNNKRTAHKPFIVPDTIRKSCRIAKTVEQKRRATSHFREWFKKEHFTLSGMKYDFGKVPNAYDVLSCLTKSPPGSFSDFCGDYGYEEDSIKAEKTYKTVVLEYDNLKMLYSNLELEEMSEIQ